jgi:hypothetical protein
MVVVEHSVRAWLVAGAMVVHGCSSVAELSEGLVLTVVVESPAPPGRESDGSLRFSSDLGYEVRLVRAYLVSSTVEIFSCRAPAASARSWARFIIGRAEAHALATPTRLGTAFVEPLTTDLERRSLGAIRPPPDRYCRVSYTASPADHDAEGMPSDQVVMGRTVYLEGTYRFGDTAVWRPFVVSSAATFSVEREIPVTELFSATPSATLAIRKQVDHWFDGVYLDSRSAESIAGNVVENIRRSIRLERL